MLTIEEYIARRKKEDKIDEFNIDERNENIRLCVNYVFEYFNNYLNITEAEEKTALKDEKLDKYRKQLKDYEQEIMEWLVGIYLEYGKQINKNIGNILKEDEFFFLYRSDKEFRSLSYDCYSRLIKKFPFLKDQTEMLFLFIKDYHRVMSQIEITNDSIFISDEINEWINKTWVKYQINLHVFSFQWVNYFWDNENLWPATHRKKSNTNYRKYDYDIKQKSKLFNLDALYRKMPKKPYTKGRKQEFEILMMYYWLHELQGDEGYWQEYLEKTLPFLQSK
ncbi:hypothetical protein [Alkalihalobacillus trypoxylicola]|uniref:Uncharacterized protein n=1 Tax=Alkalihalobacillus trypoxylicola TaxID=519424 RepID=A0A161QGV5_9BACI|nr:hypothetical protein [Alkalihalobacillus trypoxylicola]KYG28210.1 hypothetical protein AZF04_09935 [Alkalihalobacillus trypoxylicola]